MSRAAIAQLLSLTAVLTVAGITSFFVVPLIVADRTLLAISVALPVVPAVMAHLFGVMTLVFSHDDPTTVPLNPRARLPYFWRARRKLGLLSIPLGISAVLTGGVLSMQNLPLTGLSMAFSLLLMVLGLTSAFISVVLFPEKLENLPSRIAVIP